MRSVFFIFLFLSLSCKPAEDSKSRVILSQASPQGADLEKEVEPEILPFEAPAPLSDDKIEGAALLAKSKGQGCIEIFNNEKTNGYLISNDCRADEAQILQILPLASQAFKIQTAVGGYCLSFPEVLKPTDPIYPRLRRCNEESARQQWNVSRQPDKSLRITSAFDKAYCVQVPDKKGDAVTMGACSDSANQSLSRLSSVQSKSGLQGFLLAGLDGKLCLSSDAESLRSGERMILRPCRAHFSQLLDLEKVADDAYRLITPRSGLCVGESKFSWTNIGLTTDHGIQQNRCSGDNLEKWRVTIKDDGSLIIKSYINNGKCLTVPQDGGGSAIGLANCQDGNASQVFQRLKDLDKVPSSPAVADSVAKACSPIINRIERDSSSYFSRLLQVFQSIRKTTWENAVMDQIQRACAMLYIKSEDAPLIRQLDLVHLENENIVFNNGRKSLLTIKTTSHFFTSDTLWSNPKIDAGTIQDGWLETALSLVNFYAYSPSIESKSQDAAQANKLRSGLLYAVAFRSGALPSAFLRDLKAKWSDNDYKTIGSFLAYIDQKKTDFLRNLNADFRDQDFWGFDRIKLLSDKTIDDWYQEYKADPACKATEALCAL